MRVKQLWTVLTARILQRNHLSLRAVAALASVESLYCHERVKPISEAGCTI